MKVTPEEENAFRKIEAGMAAGMSFGNSVGNTSPYADEGPYGTPVTHSKKAGLTRRGKIAVAAAGVAIVGGGVIWFQAHSAAVAKDEKEAAALQVQMKQLELEEMKLRNDKALADLQAANDTAAKVQAAVDRCVQETAAHRAAKYGSPSKGAVVADCKQQYETVGSAGMAAAGSSRAASPEGGGDGINGPALLGLVAGGGLAIAVFARRGKKADT